MTKVLKKKHAQLTSAGYGEKLEIGRIQPASGDARVSAGSVGTNVVVRFQYSDDADFTSSVYGDSKTITSDTTELLPIYVNFSYARPQYVSYSGGSGATLDVASYLHY